jgi:VanZ family protein
VIRLRTPARIAMWAAIVGAVTMALLPHPPHVPIDRFGDKFEHMLAFAVMALLAAVAYPETPLKRLAERLSFLGALIEVFQSIPALHRDCDVRDWIADTISVAVVLLLYAALARRQRSVSAAT